MARREVSGAEAVRSPWRKGRVLGIGTKTRQEDKYGQRKTYKTAATGAASVYTRPAWRSGERPTHLDKPLCSGCPERVIWQLGLKSAAGSQRMYGPNCRLIAELLHGIFYFPLMQFDDLSAGVYSWHIVGSFNSTGTSGPLFPHIAASSRFSASFFPHFSFLSPSCSEKIKRNMQGCVVLLTPLLWPGCRCHSLYSAQELIMIFVLTTYVSEMTLPSVGYFYSRSALWQKQLRRSVFAILPEQKQHVSFMPDFFFSCKVNIFGLLFAYVELNSRLRIKQEKIKKIYKFVQARIHILLVSADWVVLVCLEDTLSSVKLLAQRYGTEANCWQG